LFTTTGKIPAAAAGGGTGRRRGNGSLVMIELNSNTRSERMSFDFSPLLPTATIICVYVDSGLLTVGCYGKIRVTENSRPENAGQKYGDTFHNVCRAIFICVIFRHRLNSFVLLLNLFYW